MKKLERSRFSATVLSVCLTHDVETATGLKRARVLKKVEEKYDMISAWYVPSNRYELNNDCIINFQTMVKWVHMTLNMMENLFIFKRRNS